MSARRTMTFHELVQGCTDEERIALAWHLAMLRARKTVQALLAGRLA
jgi:hypothetical protein